MFWPGLACFDICGWRFRPDLYDNTMGWERPGFTWQFTVGKQQLPVGTRQFPVGDNTYLGLQFFLVLILRWNFRGSNLTYKLDTFTSTSMTITSTMAGTVLRTISSRDVKHVLTPGIIWHTPLEDCQFPVGKNGSSQLVMPSTLIGIFWRSCWHEISKSLTWLTNLRRSPQRLWGWLHQWQEQYLELYQAEVPNMCWHQE